MPVTSQPTDQPTGQLITDEAALERIFRSNYARLVADAKRRLGDAAPAAPRVVSKAFHLAWNDRKRFHSMEELDAFLGANMQHGAARELSRQAGLHRMSHHEGLGGKGQKHEVGEMGVDEAWDRLHHTLQGGAPEAYRARASTARHEAAEHVAQLAKQRSWKPAIIIGAVGLAAALTVIFFINKSGEDRAIASALAAGDVRAYETSYGQQLNVTLDDSTVVRLGPESKLTVPRRFGIGLRAVKIDGTANFDVTRTLAQSFQVRTGQVVINARGTSFTVRRYPADPTLILFVKDDTVEVRLGEESRVVAAGNALSVTPEGAIEVPAKEKLDEARTWVDGNVTIAGQKLRYVLPQMKRWYGLNISVPDSKLLERDVFLYAPVDSPNEAIKSVEKSGGLKFGYISGNMAFQDTVPARTATKRGR
jgi:ferric-dicitrate binding protein FerR (iron transport regulator)